VWTIHCDDAWCHAGASATTIITAPTGVILGLRKLRALGVTTCIVRTDSKVVAGQVEKEYSAKDPSLMQYLTTVRSLERQFKGFTLQHIDHAKNEEADALAKATAKGEALPSDVLYHVIGTPAVRNPLRTPKATTSLTSSWLKIGGPQ
jgi:hypothetical protein